MAKIFYAHSISVLRQRILNHDHIKVVILKHANLKFN